jgi:hypothetical protein
MAKESTAEHLTASRYVTITTSAEWLTYQWKDRGKCLEVVDNGDADPMDWFPDSESSIPKKVWSVCYACPVRLECLCSAIYTNEVKGVWGGHSIKQIRRMRRKLMRAMKNRMPRSRG